MIVVKELCFWVFFEVFGFCNDGWGFDVEFVVVFDDFYDVEGVDEEGGDGGV